MRGIVSPAVQWPGEPLKTEMSRNAIPIPNELALELAAAVKQWLAAAVVSDGAGGVSSPWAIERAIRTARAKVEGLPDGFRYHDLPLLRVVADLIGCRRQGCSGAASARLGEDHPRYLRALVARQR